MVWFISRKIKPSLLNEMKLNEMNFIFRGQCRCVIGSPIKALCKGRQDQG